MTELTCACPQCDCKVDATAVVLAGKAYCCEACAKGHAGGERCRMGQCNCADAVRDEEQGAV